MRIILDYRPLNLQLQNNQIHLYVERYTNVPIEIHEKIGDMQPEGVRGTLRTSCRVSRASLLQNCSATQLCFDRKLLNTKVRTENRSVFSSLAKY